MKTPRQLANEMNLCLEVGIEHNKNCTNCAHRKMNKDTLMFFYAGTAVGLIQAGYTQDDINDASAISIKEMTSKLKGSGDYEE